MKENDVIWVSIEESDKYELSNYGFVRNKYTKKEKSFTYIKNNKYKAYYIDGIQYLAHRLVAKYFVINNNPEKYNIVNHIDENTYNNAYWNLEWCTKDEPFDKNRYAPTKQISVYNRNTNKLLFTGTIGECLNF